MDIFNGQHASIINQMPVNAQENNRHQGSQDTQHEFTKEEFTSL